MRVGFMAPPWVPVPPTAYGGTEAVIDRLARGVRTAGHEVFLWTTGDATCPVPRGHAYATAQADRMGMIPVELHHLVRGYEALQARGVDIVHDHTLIGPIFAQRYRDLPVVTTNHGPFDVELTDLYRAVCDQVPVIAISRDQASRASGLPIAAVIHHGVDLERFPVGDGAGGYVLFLGRMAPEKGARRAVVAARRAGVRLVIAAKMREPLEQQFFTEQVQPLLEEDTLFVGEVGPDEKVDLLRGAVALVNPIRWPEPFGLVMIEALACGTPVLAYGEGSAPEIVDHGVTGFVCDGMDDLVRHLGQVDELDRAACRAAAERRFTTHRMVAEHLALYRRLVDTWPGRETPTPGGCLDE